MFSVDATTEEFGNATITGQNAFVFAENLASSTGVQLVGAQRGKNSARKNENSAVRGSNL